jgi:hypothetical protein
MRIEAGFTVDSAPVCTPTRVAVGWALQLDGRPIWGLLATEGRHRELKSDRADAMASKKFVKEDGMTEAEVSRLWQDQGFRMTPRGLYDYAMGDNAAGQVRF